MFFNRHCKEGEIINTKHHYCMLYSTALILKMFLKDANNIKLRWQHY